MTALVSMTFPDLEQLEKDYIALPKDARKANLTGLNSSGLAMRDTYQSFTNTQGNETWPNLHPLTEQYYSKRSTGFGSSFLAKGSKVRFRKQKDEGGSFNAIGNNARFLVFPNTSFVLTGYAVAKKPIRFSREVEKQVARIEAGEKINVTEDMRKFFGTMRQFGETIGVDFFPLKKTTRQLNVEKRPFEPVEELARRKTFRAYEKEFVKSLARKNSLANDRSFRQGFNKAKTGERYFD